MPTTGLPAPTPLPGMINSINQPEQPTPKWPGRTIWQLLRFGLVGCLNTSIDLLALNILLWVWPTQSSTGLLFDNSLAYACGAFNSFLLNKYWTFQHRGHTNSRELARFIATTLAGTACNDLILWILSYILRPAQFNPIFATNLAKVLAIGGTVLISYLGMRLWVFAQSPHQPSSSPLCQPTEPITLLPAMVRPRTNQTQNRRAKAASLSREEGMMIAQKTPVTEWPGKGGGDGLPGLRQKLALGAVILISIFMDFYQLGQHGFGNLFYAAGVKSMTDSLHNFFFVSYDPGGFVTIDKPPLGFWLQAISARLFGFTPFSIFLPQALSGVLAVLVLFWLVRRHFGATAGLLAALALALSPLSVVTARNNTIDSVLVLTLLLGAWAIMRAAESGKWRWLLFSAALVGLGFNIKMLEAYLVVPAFGLLYLLAAPRRIWLRFGQLLVALLVLLSVSLSWALVVDLTPASQRPYVGSSRDNSEISLAFGYNGIDRLLGHFGRGNHSAAGTSRQPGADESEQRARQNFAGFGSGTPGPLRLFTVQLGGQISWLLPLALLGMLALAWQGRPHFQRDRQQQSLLLWGTWLLTMGIFFSISSFFHQYYMTTFAPAICALFGIGLVVMWRDYRRAGWRGWLLPLALILTAAEQIFFIANDPAWGIWLIPLIAIPCLLAALALGVARLYPHLEIRPSHLMSALGLGVAALLLTPATWSALPALQNMAISTPSAGPARHWGFGDWHGVDNTANAALIAYLEANQGSAKFLLATINSMAANPFILATNQPVMAMGGFAGADPILTTGSLKMLVANGKVRFFLLNNLSRLFPFFAQRNFPAGGSSSRAMPGHTSGFFGLDLSNQIALITWVKNHCTAVPANKWQGISSANRSNQPGSAAQLYDCAHTK